jgi:broad specificity phosphatase PhoE
VADEGAARRAFVVRHGNTFAPGEPPRRIGARTDLPLVASGRAQARALAAHFADRDVRFTRVLCSPLRRTRETAALIAPGAPTEPAEWLREIDHGPDEGCTEAEVIARIGADALERWEADAVAPPGWIVDAEERIAAWRRLLSSLSAGETLLVTSNGAARFLCLALKLGPAKLRTGAYAEVADGRLLTWDRRPDQA